MRRVLGPLLELAVSIGLIALALQWVLGLFGRKRTVFQANYWRGVYLLTWPIATLSVGLPPVINALGRPVGIWEIVLITVLAGAVLGFALPSFALHWQYYRHNRRTTLLFEPKRNVLEVYEGPYQLPFERRDIAQVEYVVCRTRRVFWSKYEYVRLHLHDGRIITLTSLLTKLAPLAEFLRHTHLQRRQCWFCWL
ncbi:hypothetical protein [Solirubrum puertoriconensis]|uniref:PH domain-containing protein n=1 Tax=Solirubrum puertoriconensis TaxID=1751427 RepID=A0A9X0HHZ0_SOLP1|nr:hypothetical protein [Solirubrum puertoriconensis]KUG06256.1 hypothetical protein ASU33_02530 [Solirubrum puertoriconensis]